MLHVDVRGLTAVFLGGGHNVQGQGGFTGGLRPVNLHNTSSGDAADAQGQVKGQGTGGERLHIHGNVVSQTHDGALAVVLLNFGNGGLQRLFLVAVCRGGDRRNLFLLCHIVYSFTDKVDISLLT